MLNHTILNIKNVDDDKLDQFIEEFIDALAIDFPEKPEPENPSEPAKR
jgi:hypothetical protein